MGVGMSDKTKALGWELPYAIHEEIYALQRT